MTTPAEIGKLLEQWEPELAKGYHQATEQIGSDLVAIVDVEKAQTLFLAREVALGAALSGVLAVGPTGIERLGQAARGLGGLSTAETALWLILLGVGEEKAVILTRAVFVWPSPGGDA